MRNKHTIGPWTAIKATNGHTYIKDNAGAVICQVSGTNALIDGDIEGNARLIAAAPRMLAALKIVANQIGVYGVINTGAVAGIVAEAIAEAAEE